MSFTFQPLSEEEINAMSIVSPGIYNFEVIKAEHKTSKANNPMVELQLKIWDNQGRERVVFDYLVSIPSMMYKIRNFCKCIKIMDKYNYGSFNAQDCIGKLGKAEIIIQQGQAKEGGGRYQDKNAVKDYISETQGELQTSFVPKQSEIAPPVFDEDIPF